MPPKSIPHSTPPPEVAEIAFSRNGHGKTATLSAVDMALLAESISDEGNARCANQLYQNRFLHTDALGWMRYTGTHWTARGATVSPLIVPLSIPCHGASRQPSTPGEPEKHEKLIKFCIPNKGRVQQ